MRTYWLTAYCLSSGEIVTLSPHCLGFPRVTSTRATARPALHSRRPGQLLAKTCSCAYNEGTEFIFRPLSSPPVEAGLTTCPLSCRGGSGRRCTGRRSGDCAPLDGATAQNGFPKSDGLATFFPVAADRPAPCSGSGRSRHEGNGAQCTDHRHPSKRPQPRLSPAGTCRRWRPALAPPSNTEQPVPSTVSRCGRLAPDGDRVGATAEIWFHA